jgi:hypothetical protein
VTMDHYAEAFFVEAGQCWRMVTTERQGMPAHCAEPVEWRGRTKDGRGRWHVVWSCSGHADELVGAKRL